ncbi:MAG: hypothetical protein KGZ39_06650 [Simkania sp.]|nr:hypothetical protein [Simkania sp.]
MSVQLNFDSFTKICPNAQQVLVCGYEHCKFVTMIHELENRLDSPVQKVFRVSIGDPTCTGLDDVYTLEGLPITKVELDSNLLSSKHKERSRRCKAAITNLIFTNFQRQKSKLPIIPILFCIDITNNHHSTKVQHILWKRSRAHSLITHHELRRVYKLYKHEDGRIRKIARQTFRFAKVNVTEKEYILEPLKLPWAKNPAWGRAWAKRKQQTTSIPKINSWRDRLKSLLSEEDPPKQPRRKKELPEPATLAEPATWVLPPLEINSQDSL